MRLFALLLNASLLPFILKVNIFFDQALISIDFFGNFQNVGNLLIFVAFSMCFEFLQKGSKNPNSVHNMAMIVESILFAHSQLVVVIVKTFLGQSDHFGCLSQRQCNPFFALAKFSPLFNNLNHFQNNSFFASLSLFRLSFRLIVKEYRTSKTIGAQSFRLHCMILYQNDRRSIVKYVIWHMKSYPQRVDVYISVDPEVINPDIDIFKLLQSIGKQGKQVDLSHVSEHFKWNDFGFQGILVLKNKSSLNSYWFVVVLH